MKNNIIKAFAVSLICVLLALTLCDRYAVFADYEPYAYGLWYHKDSWTYPDDGWVNFRSDDATLRSGDYWDLVFHCLMRSRNLTLQQVQTIFFSIEGFEDYYINYDLGFDTDLLCNVWYFNSKYYIMFLRSDVQLPTSFYFDSDGLHISGGSYLPNKYVYWDIPLCLNIFTNVSYSDYRITNWIINYNAFDFSTGLVDTWSANDMRHACTNMAFEITLDPDIPSAVSSVSILQGLPTNAAWIDSPRVMSFSLPFQPLDTVTAVRGALSNYGSFIDYGSLTEPLYFIIDTEHVYQGYVSPDLTPSPTPDPNVTPTLSLTPPIQFTTPIPVPTMVSVFNPFSNTQPLFGFLTHSYTITFAPDFVLSFNPLMLLTAIVVVTILFEIFIGGRKE